MDSKDTKTLPLRTLIDDGLLFEINRLVMHPIGRALVLEETTDDGFKAYVVETDDMEGFLFAPESFLAGRAKSKAYMAKEGDARLHDREGVLGFLLQQKAEDGDVDDVK